MISPSETLSGLSVREGEVKAITRVLPEETPIAIVCNGTSQAVMMCTPLDLEDFAHGFALTEGFIQTLDQVESFDLIDHDSGTEARFTLSGEPAQALADRRRKMIGPLGCGLCGIDSIEEATRPLPSLASVETQLSAGDVMMATDALRACQPLHDKTNAMHAAGFFQPGRGVMLAREDVGRHNALDKLIGALAQKQMDASQGAIVLTSRVSIEMVQKCAMAGCAILIAVSAPTHHAARLAEKAGITLATLARSTGFELFAHPHRIQMEALT